MGYKTGDVVVADFCTQDPATGAATDADSLPTGKLVVNGTDNAASVTVTNKATGNYKAAVTLPAVASGDTLQLRIAATVGSVAGKGVVWAGVGDTKRNSDLQDIAAGTAMTLTTGERTAVANEVEAQIIDETDSEKVLTAITDKIASVNPSLSGLTLAAIASAVRDVSNASPAGASLGAVLNSVNAKTVNLPADPAGFAGLASAHGAGSWATATGFASAADVASALNTYDAPTKAELDAAVALLATSAQLVKVLAAVYDSVSRSGSILTLSNGATQTIGAGGRTTAGG